MIDLNADIGQVLEAFARSQPTAPALHVPGRRSVTYADLGAQIRYVRQRLGEWHVARGDIVAGVIPQRPEMALACAAVPGAATFAPLSAALTVAEYAELLTRLTPKVVIVPAGMNHPVRLAAQRCGVAEVDLIAQAGGPAGVFTLGLTRPDRSLDRAASSGLDLAYVLGTSGTTGRPKLVPTSHRRLTLYAQCWGDWLRLTADDVGCHIQPMHHGHGLNSSLMIPLLRGGSVVCLPEGDIAGFFAALDEYRITWLTAVFTLHREILRRAPHFRKEVAGNRLRFIRVGSGRLEPDEIERIERTFAAPVLVGLIAQETFLITHDPLPPRARKRGSTGVTLGNQVGVMNESGEMCARGDVGEIVVKGPLVFDGYLNDAQATAAAFVGGWFRTGDLGRFDSDGYLFLVGRAKEIINRGGEKISPVEIDAAIESVPGVRAAATFGIPHRTLGEEIGAAIVREGAAAITASEILDNVRERVGPMRVPRMVYFVDDLPRTDSGKIRRSDLPRLLGLDRTDVSAAPAPEARGAPMSPLEAALAGLWASVLDLKSVGRTDDFIMLGGDSLTGTRLVAQVEAVFGVDLRTESFSEATTVAGMARMIESTRARSAVPERAHDPLADSTIPRRRERGPAFLSDTQKRVWFLAKLDPDSAGYNESRAYKLIGAIDVGALRRALRFIAGRHEILRTTYSLVDDEPRQIVHDKAAVDLQLVDLAETPTVQQDEAVKRLLSNETRRAFDLEAGPILRLVLVRLGEREHVLLRVVHHIATDGWSAGIFDRELSSAYNAFVSDRDPDLADLPIQYADYAVWRREWLRRGVLEQQLRYWKARLADLPTLTLPTDRPRPAVVSYRGARAVFDLPASLTPGLKDVGQREGATLFMTLLAAFQVLLCRYSGQDDIVVGVPIAGRRRFELEGLIGFFANTLVLRADLSGNPPFRELLARVRESALGAYTHQEMPFETLVERLAPARDPSRNPLFQVSFALQNTPGGALAFEEVETTPLELTRNTAKFDLYLAVRETPAGLRLSWEYSTDLFDASTIERMTRHFGRLLEAIVADPEQRIGELPLLAEAERHQLLVQWNDTAADYPRNRCIHQLFEAQAARTPDAVAVLFEDRQLTYAELNARANRLAHHLIDLGVKPEVLVGLCMERSLELIVGLLGILKAGGAYVPLDPSYPKDRLAFMLKDTAAPVLLTQRMLLQQLPQYEGRILCLDRDWPDISADGQTNPANSAAAESLAYVMYTSGSTGTPKGVAVPHRGVLRLLLGNDYVQFGERQTFLLLSPISFDASTFEVWGALLHGARCAIFRERVPSIETLGEALERYRVTTLWLTASLFNAIVDEAPHILSGLRQLLTGGEALSPAHVRSALECLPDVQLINGYGPTENTTFTCCYRIPERVDETRQSIPIGRPIGNTRVYLLNEHLSPVPLGAPGELCIGGDGLARGYLNRPELTAEKFLPDPFSETPGARLYRTGDRARYLADGNIEFLGRFDDQVKIRGFRIEPGEIEAVLTEHPAVRQALVVVREDTPGDKRLVAYVAPADASSNDSEPLRALLRERLPEYMLPCAYVMLERLPLTPSGKVDRGALPAPQYERDVSGHTFVPARNSLEASIAEVWCEVLKLDRVGVHDNFFELGGHSLLAAQIVARLARLLHIELPLRRMFETPTIGELARAVARMSEEAGETPLERILREVEALTDEEAALQLNADSDEGVISR